MRAITITITKQTELVNLDNFIGYINTGDDVAAVKIGDNKVFIAVAGGCSLAYVESVAANRFYEYEIENLK